MGGGPTTSQAVGVSLREATPGDDDGLDTRALRRGDTLTLQTRNSVYTLRLDDPSRGWGVATGNGKFLTDPVRSRLVGATLSGRGSMVKLGWVLVGFKLVLAVPGGELLTSQVREIWVNGAPVVAASRVH